MWIACPYAGGARRVRCSGVWGAFTAATRSMPGPRPTPYKDPPTRARFHLIIKIKPHTTNVTTLEHHSYPITIVMGLYWFFRHFELSKTIVIERIYSSTQKWQAAGKSLPLTFSHSLRVIQHPFIDNIVVLVHSIYGLSEFRHARAPRRSFVFNKCCVQQIIPKIAYSSIWVDTWLFGAEVWTLSCILIWCD